MSGFLDDLAGGSRTARSASDAVISCRKYVLAALIAKMDERSHADLTWIDIERQVVAAAANEWAISHPPAITISVEDIERIEAPAVGHIDYASKLALYVAEFVVTTTTNEAKGLA